MSDLRDGEYAFSMNTKVLLIFYSCHYRKCHRIKHILVKPFFSGHVQLVQKNANNCDVGGTFILRIWDFVLTKGN
jgi:hypothetical protein